jgi:hypothetical protein
MTRSAVAGGGGHFLQQDVGEELANHIGQCLGR